MAFTPNFSASQSASNPGTITLTDDSTGSDGAITSRKILVQLANGNYLTLNGETATLTYITWNLADMSITLPNILPRSESPSITVYWLDVGGATLYQKVINGCFDLADYIFGLGLTLRQVANNTITQDRDWYANKMQLIVNANDAENSIFYINDITLSQNALDKNYELILNANKYF